VSAAGADELVLVDGPEGKELRRPAERGEGLRVDVVGGEVGRRLRQGSGKRTPLARAVGLAKASVRLVDATAGLGVESALLAWAGAQVTAIERHPQLAALWRDALARANDAGAEVAERITFVEGDAREVLARLPEDERPDCVYLDPMFPARRKSAQVKKKMQLMQLLHGELDEDADRALLEVALDVARRRVVVKRPKGAPPLAGGVSHTYATGTTRFDVYLR
jgi:16S rRNA (guanine1516-N2)-methyltransferase